MAPAELEGLLLTHPAVADCAVIGVPDSIAGELPKAFVVVKQGNSVTPQQLQIFVEGKFAYLESSYFNIMELANLIF